MKEKILACRPFWRYWVDLPETLVRLSSCRDEFLNVNIIHAVLYVINFDLCQENINYVCILIIKYIQMTSSIFSLLFVFYKEDMFMIQWYTHIHQHCLSPTLIIVEIMMHFIWPLRISYHQRHLCMKWKFLIFYQQ